MDEPWVLPTLAQWFVETWAPYYGPGGPGDAESDLGACCNRDTLPVCLVALNANGNVLGTAALKTESVGDEIASGPWLAALLVGKNLGGEGVGTALVEAIEEEACRLGFTSIYTSTDLADGIIERRQWQVIGVAESLRGQVEVYRRGLSGETP